MDKNTLLGLLLMAALFFGFMYFSPKDPQPTDGPDANTEIQNTSEPQNPDNLNDNETEWLKANIRQQGAPSVNADATTRTYTLSQNGVNLSLSGDSIFGTVNINGKHLNWADIVAANPAAMTIQEQRQAIETVRNLSNSIGRYGKFSQFLTGTDSIIVLENDVLSLHLNTHSGTITKAELKKYDTEYHSDETVRTKRKVVLFDSTTNTFAFDIPLAQAITTSDLYFTPSLLNDSTVLMSLPLGNGAYWGLRYTLPKGDSYVVNIDVVQKNAAQIVKSNNRTLGFHWNQQMARQEKGRSFEERQSALYYKFAGGSVENLSDSKNDKEDRKAKIRWIGFKNQFFSSVIISRRPFNTADFSSEIEKRNDFLKNLTADAEVNDYDWSASTPASFSLFLGPNLYPLLSHLDKTIDAGENLNLTRMIPLGWSLFRWINTGIVIPVFTFLGSFISNYGIIILLLTIFIKLILFPLTYKSLISQAKMRVLAPDIKAINDKYPGKDQAMLRQQKTMALYSKAGASPFSGCLPMLLQMPILFAMFSFFPSCIELRGQSFLWAHDLSAPDAIISWSTYIPLVTPYFGNHISLFCLLMTATNIIYTYLNMQNQANSMPGTKWMMYLMPVFFLVFFNNYASGLSYYYFLSLLITIIQTYAFRYFVKEDDVRKAMAENAKKPKKKSGFMARLEEMQKQQQAMMREQQSRQGKRGK